MGKNRATPSCCNNEKPAPSGRSQALLSCLRCRTGPKRNIRG
uniref:Uncharacterized protein n=1 Tax=Siphoviridae sp. ctDCt3 TaxID=2825385 RepID=A0A8S5U260_9CAUD|nr:MAG TPA: hypothetical protein [Siphoviridae sp. ctDCt3]DAI62091.1 MAG TPA: hypothetical protein [Caudoviricetes sp.]